MRQGAVIQLLDLADPLRSDTTLLAAALLTLGIPPISARSFFHVTYEQVRGEIVTRATWSFVGESKCRRFATDAMQAAWESPVWLLKNAKHPLAILRGGLTYARALQLSPRFTLQERTAIETPDTWLEAACMNLVFLLRHIPRSAPKGIVRFGPENYSATVPRIWPERQKADFLRYVERPDLRPQLSHVLA